MNEIMNMFLVLCWFIGMCACGGKPENPNENTTASTHVTDEGEESLSMPNQGYYDKYLKILQCIADNGTPLLEEKDVNNYGRINGYTYEKGTLRFSFSVQNGETTPLCKLHISNTKYLDKDYYGSNIVTDCEISQYIDLDVENAEIIYNWNYNGEVLTAQFHTTNTLASGKIAEKFYDITPDHTDYLIQSFTEQDSFRKVSGYNDIRAVINDDFQSMLAEVSKFMKKEADVNLKDIGFLNYPAYDPTVNYVGMSSKNQTIATGFNHAVAIKEDGTVIATGDNTYGQCDVSSWTDIVAVSAGWFHTVGLKSDGTVVAVGLNGMINPIDNSIFPGNQCNVTDWTDIVAICAGYNETYGIKADGTVVSTDSGSNAVLEWTDVIGISADGNCVVGLRSDGTVVAYGSNQYGECNVSDWTDVVDIAVGINTTVGLRSDGTVCITGFLSDRVDVSEWDMIVDIGVSSGNCVGIDSYGTLFTTDGATTSKNYVSVCATNSNCVLLKTDGTVEFWGLLDTSNWTNIKLPE